MYYIVGSDTEARVYKIRPRPFGEWEHPGWLRRPPASVEITVNRLAPVADMFKADVHFLVASVRFVRVLHEIGTTHIEDFPVEMIDFCSKVRDTDGFRVLWLQDPLACIIDPGAYVNDETGRLRRTEPVIFDESRIAKGRHFFALHSNPLATAGSEELKLGCQQAGIDIVKFTPVKDLIPHW